MTQDTHRAAVEEFDDAREAMRDQYAKMRDDLRFSDPTDPQQWDKQAIELRSGRPCLTFDRTNQFIAQVVNAARQNKPSIHVLPANSEAAVEVAEKLNGIIRHIEYVSRAGIAYDTATEYAARIGLGWMRVVPEIIRPETNEQEIRIKRIADPLSCYLEAGWTEPDGSDAMLGFIETMFPMAAFKRQWPKARTDSWEAGHGWFDEKQVRVCERFKIIETKERRIAIEFEGERAIVSEDKYWALRQETGMEIPASPFDAKIRSVKWSKLSGCEVLDETEFPSQFLPLIPVVGHELIVDGKRHLCGMTRRLMDSQRAYNYERSAFIESVAMQPKAPIMAPFESMDGHENEWARLNQGNPAVLPYNHVDEAGNPIPAPTRMAPPAFPIAFAQGGQIASTDMESAVGMFRANLGAPGSAVSGRAKREDKVAGDTANFHYTDNLSRSIEQLGRVVVDMIPRIYDTPRQARIVGEDGSHEFVQVDPGMKQAVQKRGKKVVSINPGIGAYDVRVKTGPAYTTLREEQAEQLAHIMQAAPNLVPILADLWVGAQDWPEAERVKKRLEAMLPPQVLQAESDEGDEVPPAAQAHINQLSQQVQELSQALEQAHQEVTQLEQKTQGELAKKQMEVQAKAQAEDAKGQREMDVELLKAHVAKQGHMLQLLLQRMKDETALQVAELSANTTLTAAQMSAADAAEAEEPTKD